MTETSQTFQRRKDFLCLTVQDEHAMRSLHDALGTQAHGFVEGFYRHLLSFPEMRALLPDDEALHRLKTLQMRYFLRLTKGTYDEAYGDERQHVGLAHARIGLSPGWYLGAYSHYLTELLPRITRLPGLTPEQRNDAIQALIKVVLLDIGLAIDSYITHRDTLITELRDYGAAFAHLPHGTLVVTDELNVVFANQAFAQLAGQTPMALAKGDPLPAFMDVGSLPALVKQALQHQHAKGRSQLHFHAQALAIPVSITVHSLQQPDGHAQPRLLITVEDLRKQEQLNRDLLNAQEVANIGTWLSYFDGKPSLTPQAARILGWPVGQPFEFADLLGCVHAEDRAYADAQWKEGLATGRYAFEMRIQDGTSVRWVDALGTIERDATGKPVRGYGTLLDITERKRTEQRMKKLAFFDALTGLPNRFHGIDLAQRLLDIAGQRGQQATVLFVDLDRFKEINDSQGHLVGDDLLAEVARRCERTLGGDGVVARLGGDEFMFVRTLAEGNDAMALAHEFCSTLASPLRVDDLCFEVRASVGVALYPMHGHSVDELLQRADIAMYQVKTQGGGNCQLYDAQMGHRLQRRIALGAKLEEALAQSRLELHFQPKIAIDSYALYGVEALARWHDEEWGWVSPAEFIPVAEERGLIIALGDWSLDAAARQWRAWSSAGIAQPPVIAVNVSAAQMMSDAFSERALAIMRTHDVSPRFIELEITESALMHDPAKAKRVASQLVEQGFTLSIDDFGTGYSSLARLQSFPVSRLKIDMSFVRGMLSEPGSLAIVTAVIGLAHALKLRTVAEGVETQSQLEKLRDLHCDEVQGYLFSKAVPAAELARDWLPL
ncbi:EAL domain-containing protein [Comamonas sp. 26]|uniref:EAL domain-containing protein n=1 Tax=Comamonas sp. 26 TaxID=2035201 RepID=UPI000C17F5AF|nr:EAL domain-containing protein [Comamonas sp. 26]